MARKRRSPAGSAASEGSSSRGLASLNDWAQEHTQLLVIASIVVILGAAVAVYYMNYLTDLRVQATDEFERIQTTVVGLGNTAEAQTELQTFLDRFGDTFVADEARLLLAEAHLHENVPEQAIETLQPLTQSLSDPLSIQGGFLLGTALEHAGRNADAEEVYLRVADAAEMTFQVRDALADAARLRAARADYAGAAEVYERILATFDEEDAQNAQNSQSAQGALDADRSTYRLRLAEMRAAAEAA